MKPRDDASVSLNRRIRSDIENKILDGTWPPGHRIPAEHELMAEYDCSRMTVNKALSALAERGWLLRRYRAGTFVARRHIESAVLEIPDLPREIAARGHRYELRLLSRRRQAAGRRNAAMMELPAGTPLLALHCLHLADAQPFAVEERLINLAVVPEAATVDFSAVAPGSWLLDHIPWTQAQHRIHAVNADADTAMHLQVAAGAACLVLERQTWRGEEGITYARQTFLGEAYDLIARFAPGPASRNFASSSA
jgi:GntR family histidine utilization transcriptional repressor